MSFGVVMNSLGRLVRLNGRPRRDRAKLRREGAVLLLGGDIVGRRGAGDG